MQLRSTQKVGKQRLKKNGKDSTRCLKNCGRSIIARAKPYPWYWALDALHRSSIGLHRSYRTDPGEFASKSAHMFTRPCLVIRSPFSRFVAISVTSFIFSSFFYRCARVLHLALSLSFLAIISSGIFVLNFVSTAPKPSGLHGTIWLIFVLFLISYSRWLLGYKEQSRVLLNTLF